MNRRDVLQGLVSFGIAPVLPAVPLVALANEMPTEFVPIQPSLSEASIIAMWEDIQRQIESQSGLAAIDYGTGDQTYMATWSYRQRAFHLRVIPREEMFE